MVELFFIKRFILQSLIPYMTLFMSISYIIFEISFPKQIKEKFYIYSDKLFFKFVIRPIERTKKILKKIKLNLSIYSTKKKNKRLEKKKAREVAKKQKQLKANEKSKVKLNKKIDKVNKKANKYQKKVDKNKNKSNKKKTKNSNKVKKNNKDDISVKSANKNKNKK